jgi:hypothetical protein
MRAICIRNSLTSRAVAGSGTSWDRDGDKALINIHTDVATQNSQAPRMIISMLESG